MKLKRLAMNCRLITTRVLDTQWHTRSEIVHQLCGQIIPAPGHDEAANRKCGGEATMYRPPNPFGLAVAVRERHKPLDIVADRPSLSDDG